MIDLSKLMPDEGLGRRVSSRRDRRYLRRGDAPLSLFARRGTYKLSVDRMHDDYLSEATAIAVNYDKSRERTFYGWAVVTQDVASKHGRYVEPSPQQDNEYHADIVLPVIVASDKKKRDQHAAELAARAHWQAPHSSISTI